MSITYNTTLAGARLQKVLDALDVAGAAKLVLGTSALAGGVTGTLVTFTLDNPSGTISGRVLTISGTPKTAVASAGGVTAKAELRTGAGVVIADGLTIGAAGSAADIIIDTTSIVNGRTIYLLSVDKITHP